jgi:nucleoid DNA-binding protein
MAGKRMTKSQIIGELADKTGLTKKDVTSVFEEIRNLVKRELGRRGPGEFVVPDLLKMKVKNVPASKDREGINPFTKEKIQIKGKPAHKKVRATPLKKLKEIIQ